MRHQSRFARRPGFTLIELLVVIAIIGLVSVATIPAALAILGDQEISDAASTVQATFAMTRDTALRSKGPAGLRLVPDPTLSDPFGANGEGGRFAANRLLELTTPPDYSEGYVIPVIEILDVDATFNPTLVRLSLWESRFELVGGTAIRSSPTSWYYNIRQGETIRLQGSSDLKIVGPITQGPNNPDFPNPERFINETVNLRANGNPVRSLPLPNNFTFERLYVTNREDDDGDGYVDEMFDGIDNDADGLVDTLYNGLDDNTNNLVDEPIEFAVGEFENDQVSAQLFPYVWNRTRPGEDRDSNGRPRLRLTTEVTLAPPNERDFCLYPYVHSDGALTDPEQFSVVPLRYTIQRRPLPAPDGRTIDLPSNVVIDLTTLPQGVLGRVSSPERSHVPLDPNTGYVDLMIYPDGRVLPSTPFGNFNALNDFPYYFLWLTEREGVVEPIDADPTTVGLQQPLLPMPANTPNYGGARVLEGQRRMVVISPNTGRASVQPIEDFNGRDVNAPFHTSSGSGPGGGTPPL